MANIKGFFTKVRNLKKEDIKDTLKRGKNAGDDLGKTAQWKVQQKMAAGL